MEHGERENRMKCMFWKLHLVSALSEIQVENVNDIFLSFVAFKTKEGNKMRFANLSQTKTKKIYMCLTHQECQKVTVLHNSVIVTVILAFPSLEKKSHSELSTHFQMPKKALEINSFSEFFKSQRKYGRRGHNSVETHFFSRFILNSNYMNTSMGIINERKSE